MSNFKNDPDFLTWRHTLETAIEKNSDETQNTFHGNIPLPIIVHGKQGTSSSYAIIAYISENKENYLVFVVDKETISNTNNLKWTEKPIETDKQRLLTKIFPNISPQDYQDATFTFVPYYFSDGFSTKQVRFDFQKLCESFDSNEKDEIELVNHPSHKEMFYNGNTKKYPLEEIHEFMNSPESIENSSEDFSEDSSEDSEERRNVLLGLHQSPQQPHQSPYQSPHQSPQQPYQSPHQSPQQQMPLNQQSSNDSESSSYKKQNRDKRLSLETNENNQEYVENARKNRKSKVHHKSNLRQKKNQNTRRRRRSFRPKKFQKKPVPILPSNTRRRGSTNSSNTTKKKPRSTGLPVSAAIGTIRKVFQNDEWIKKQFFAPREDHKKNRWYKKDTKVDEPYCDEFGNPVEKYWDWKDELEKEEQGYVFHRFVNWKVKDKETKEIIGYKPGTNAPFKFTKFPELVDFDAEQNQKQRKEDKFPREIKSGKIGYESLRGVLGRANAGYRLFQRIWDVVIEHYPAFNTWERTYDEEQEDAMNDLEDQNMEE